MDKLIELIETRRSIRKYKSDMCNYCDGGNQENSFGYRGACSDQLIEYNMYTAKRDWCTQSECPCNQYYHSHISREELDAKCKGDNYVCYESGILRNWIVRAGFNNHGINKGAPRKFKRAHNNAIVILTTRKPNTAEEERVIFGVFLTEEFSVGNENGEGFLKAYPEYRIELTQSEAERLLFWNYFYNQNEPDRIRWSSGLFRYINDIQGIQILRDIRAIKESAKEKTTVNNMIQYICKLKNLHLEDIPEPNGALLR